MQGNNPQEELDSIIAKLRPQEGDPGTETPKGNQEREPLEEETGATIHIHYFPDAIVILKEGEEGTHEHNIVDTTLVSAPVKEESVVPTAQPAEQEVEPQLNGKENPKLAIPTLSFNILLILSCLTFQLYSLLNPPTVTVTVIPKSQAVTLTGTLQLGRLLHPITVSQTATSPTTGKGHQDARVATGFLTFYNGQLNSVTVPAGTVLTGANGVHVITEQAARIPAATPPIEGQTTITAHAMSTGSSGNIAVKSINDACCAISVLVVNLTPFHGGQDERNFQTATKQDIATTAAPLATAVEQSMQAALQPNIHQSDGLYIFPCAPTVTSDHKVGQEATEVTVTVSETCSAVAYNTQALETKATAMLSHQAATQLGTGYSLMGDVHVTIKQATVTHTASSPLVVFSFSTQGTWVYAVTNAEQQHMQSLIEGKTKQDALHMLLSLPGIERASISWADNTTLPKDTRNIHIVLIYAIEQ
jgi:VCBS repeat-containing protein